MIELILKNLRWLGHDTFLLQLEEKLNIYFDPYNIPDGLPKADIIMISHDHYDHCSPEDIAKIQTESTIFVTEKDSAKKLTGKVICLVPGENTEVGPIKISAVAAYNTNKKFHPKANGWLGFLVKINDTTIYHAGDTDHIPEMGDIATDIALLPVSGTYVMTPTEAAQAALNINPQVAIPMHFCSLIGTMEDAKKFAKALVDSPIRVKIL